MKKKIISMLLAFTMVFGTAVPSFADAGSKVASFNKPIYTAWSDSMGAGCKSSESNCQARYMEYRNIPNGIKDWSVNALPYTYVSKFAKSINADVANSYNGTQPGMRAKDYCYVLGLISEEEFKYYNYDSSKAENIEDGWSTTNMLYDQLPDLINAKAKYEESISKADVITIELGANDFTTYVTNDYPMIEEIFTVLMGETTANTKAVLERLKEDFNALSKDFSKENLDKLCQDLQSLKSDAKIYKELIEKLAKNLTTATRKTRHYWDLMMSYINRHKKPGAIVIATTVPNPLSGIDLDLGIDVDILQIAQPFVNDKNAYMRLVSKKYGYVVADIDGIILNSQFDETDSIYDADWGKIQPNKEGKRIADYSMHPNPDEHTKIYNALRKAYDKKRTSRKVKATAVAVAATTAVVTATAVKAGAQDHK